MRDQERISHRKRSPVPPVSSISLTSSLSFLSLCVSSHFLLPSILSSMLVLYMYFYDYGAQLFYTSNLV